MAAGMRGRRQDSLEEILSYQEWNVNMLRERGFGMAEHVAVLPERQR